jgi:virginiamycin B lyase
VTNFRLKPDAVFEVLGAPDWIAIDDSVWISNKPGNSVTRIDPGSNRVLETIPAGSAPCAGLAIGFGSLWVPNYGDKTLLRIDLQSHRAAATLSTAIADTEGTVAAGAGSFWLLTDNKGKLTRFDPTTNRVAAEIPVASGSFAAAFGHGAVWVTSPRTIW